MPTAVRVVRLVPLSEVAETLCLSQGASLASVVFCFRHRKPVVSRTIYASRCAKKKETAIVRYDVVHVPGSRHVAGYFDVPTVTHVVNRLTTFHILKHRNFLTRSAL